MELRGTKSEEFAQKIIVHSVRRIPARFLIQESCNGPDNRKQGTDEIRYGDHQAIQT
jgi:hypothetical protein